MSWFKRYSKLITRHSSKKRTEPLYTPPFTDRETTLAYSELNDGAPFGVSASGYEEIPNILPQGQWDTEFWFRGKKVWAGSTGTSSTFKVTFPARGHGTLKLVDPYNNRVNIGIFVPTAGSAVFTLVGFGSSRSLQARFTPATPK